MKIILLKLKPVRPMPDVFSAILNQNKRALKKKSRAKGKQTHQRSSKALQAKNNRLGDVNYINRAK